MSAEDTAALLMLGQGPVLQIPPETVVHEFLRHAGGLPGSLAVSSPEREASYGDLRRYTLRICRELRQHGIDRGDFVVITCAASVDLLAAELATMLVRAAFIPIDPSTPTERAGGIVRSSSAKVVLTHRSLIHLTSNCPQIVLEDLLSEAGEMDGPTELPEPEDIAYVIYTSGSTGEPKGAMIEHSSLMNLIAHYRSELCLGAQSRTSLISGVAFDASMADIWPALTSGGSVHIPPPAMRTDPEGLLKWLASERINVSFVPTALAELILESDWPAVPDLEVLLTGGDKLNRQPARAFSFRVINTYGPTETTVDATWFDLSPTSELLKPPPIGRPIANFVAVVLDPSTLRLVPRGVPGILFLGGPGVARGYLNRPDLTSERFTCSPWDGRTLYNTGDRVYWNGEGQLEFMGREDGQVQLRGFRIELAEITFHLHRCPGIRQAAVAMHTPENGVPILLAAVVADPDRHPAVRDLMVFLASYLPPYMIQARYLFLNELPLTPNGKVDVRRLPLNREELIDTQKQTFTNELEKQISSIFGTVLGARDLSSDVNLFDAGVDSLALLRILCELNRSTGYTLHLPDLLRFPTAGQLAKHLKEGSDESSGLPAAVIPLNQIRTGTPLFCIPGAGGGTHWFQAFAKAPEWACPVFGLEPLLLNEAASIHRTIEEIAAEFVAAAGSIQQTGPWKLCGFSVGGL